MFRKIGAFRFPLRTGPAVATQLFEMRNTVSDRRIATNRAVENSDCREFREAVQRNVNRARVRLDLAQVGAGAAIRDQDGNTTSDQSGDELIPPAPHATLVDQTSFPIMDPTWNKERGGNMGGRCPNPSSPKRDGDPLDEPDSKMAQAGEAAESEMEDQAFTQRNKIGMPNAKVVVTAPQEELRRAGQEPNRGWPASPMMYPMGGPALIVRDPILISKNYLNLDAHHGWVTGDPTGPLARALTLAGAARADAGNFRAPGANSGMIRPLVRRDFQV